MSAQKATASYSEAKPRLRSIPRRLRSFTRLPGHRRALVIEAWAWLLVARWTLILVPFPHVARRLGTFVPPTDPRAAPIGANSSAQSTIAREVRWAVTTATRTAPFHAVCLPQAMAARLMLSRRGVGSVMHFGARMAGEPKSLDAHAWLDAAGVKVTGYPVAREIAEIACFV
jgi:hypothetical protein